MAKASYGMDKSASRDKFIYPVRRIYLSYGTKIPALRDDSEGNP
ncbi:hypothetical protein HMPREF9445_02223 [Bacteroides clarus YIT 12056]|uniref:Uncharacterized protein n=1 Tax=Bacteroides clarus YIT 12056 TaxID=762984 RepID=A0ABP2KQE4_9BACE|nr:hypothetical protein HMPREF9445_02223 [Bacteroides clarus YIT 12056]